VGREKVGARAQGLEPGDDGFERSPALVAEEVHFVDHHQRDVAEEGHPAAVLVLSRDAVELLGGGEDDVHVAEFGPGLDVGVAGELAARHAQGGEARDPVLLLLLHEGLQGGHVYRLALAGAVLERAVRAVHAVKEHLHDRELEEDGLAAPGGGA
jgi:hypothetical protein